MKNKERKNLIGRTIWLWLIFIVVLSNTILNIMFTFGWVDIFWGASDDIPNNGHGYTIAYWWSHISYISSVLITTWSAYELVCHYLYPDHKTNFVFRFYSVVWITITMVSFMPQFYWFYKDEFKSLIDGYIPDDWPGTDAARYIYVVLNIWQGFVMHAVVPVMVLIFYSLYDGRTDRVTKKQIKTFAIVSICFLLYYLIYNAIFTYQGGKEPYPILNWNPDDTNKWPIPVQILCCLGFVLVYYSWILPPLYFMKRRTEKWEWEERSTKAYNEANLEGWTDNQIELWKITK